MASTYSRDELDPFAEARWRSQLAKQQVDDDARSTAASPRAAVPSARNFYSERDASISPGGWKTPSYINSESSPLNDSASLQKEMQATAAGNAMNYLESVQSARETAEAQIANAEKQARASTGASWLQAGAQVIGTALPLVFCDARVKCDVEPLASGEINDELSKLAFIVKWLRGDP